MGALFQITGNVAQPVAGTRILKAAEFALLTEANSLLAQARARADEIAQKAEEAYQQRKEEGYKDGREEGLLEHAEKLMETVMSSVEFIEGIETTLIDVVNQAVRKIIGELDSNERIVRIVQEGLRNVRNQSRVTVRVSPADDRAVRTALEPMLRSSSGSASFLELVPDARLEQGACILESELGVIDASLETQLKALEKAFTSRIQAGNLG